MRSSGRFVNKFLTTMKDRTSEWLKTVGKRPKVAKLHRAFGEFDSYLDEIKEKFINCTQMTVILDLFISIGENIGKISELFNNCMGELNEADKSIYGDDSIDELVQEMLINAFGDNTIKRTLEGIIKERFEFNPVEHESENEQFFQKTLYALIGSSTGQCMIEDSTIAKMTYNYLFEMIGDHIKEFSLENYREKESKESQVEMKSEESEESQEGVSREESEKLQEGVSREESEKLQEGTESGESSDVETWGSGKTMKSLLESWEREIDISTPIQEDTLTDWTIELDNSRQIRNEAKTKKTENAMLVQLLKQLGELFVQGDPRKIDWVDKEGAIEIFERYSSNILNAMNAEKYADNGEEIYIEANRLGENGDYSNAIRLNKKANVLLKKAISLYNSIMELGSVHISSNMRAIKHAFEGGNVFDYDSEEERKKMTPWLYQPVGEKGMDFQKTWQISLQNVEDVKEKYNNIKDECENRVESLEDLRFVLAEKDPQEIQFENDEKLQKVLLNVRNLIRTLDSANVHGTQGGELYKKAIQLANVNNYNEALQKMNSAKQYYLDGINEFKEIQKVEVDELLAIIQWVKGEKESSISLDQYIKFESEIMKFITDMNKSIVRILNIDETRFRRIRALFEVLSKNESIVRSLQQSKYSNEFDALKIINDTLQETTQVMFETRKMMNDVKRSKEKKDYQTAMSLLNEILNKQKYIVENYKKIIDDLQRIPNIEKIYNYAMSEFKKMGLSTKTRMGGSEQKERSEQERESRPRLLSQPTRTGRKERSEQERESRPRLLSQPTRTGRKESKRERESRPRLLSQPTRTGRKESKRERESRPRLLSQPTRTGRKESKRERESRPRLLSQPTRTGRKESKRERESRQRLLSQPTRTGRKESKRERESRQRLLSQPTRTGRKESKRERESRPRLLSQPTRTGKTKTKAGFVQRSTPDLGKTSELEEFLERRLSMKRGEYGSDDPETEVYDPTDIEQTQCSPSVSSPQSTLTSRVQMRPKIDPERARRLASFFPRTGNIGKPTSKFQIKPEQVKSSGCHKRNVGRPKVRQVERPKITPVERPKVRKVERPKVRKVERPKITPVETPPAILVISDTNLHHKFTTLQQCTKKDDELIRKLLSFKHDLDESDLEIDERNVIAAAFNKLLHRFVSQKRLSEEKMNQLLF